MSRLNWSKLVTTSRRIVMTVLLAGLGLTICLPSLADALDLRRKFYLTQGTFQGNQALTACDKGFHMASLWEIFDPSNLKYDTTRGQTLADSGSGPPGDLFGWIRTGVGNANAVGPGVANCFTWTSASVNDDGTIVLLEPTWTASSTAISPWRATVLTCNNLTNVWCVQH